MGAPRCVAYRSDFDWEGDRHPDIPIEESIIYEVNVRGFTRHHSSESDLAGTYRGFIEKIPYLKELGITAVELLPVMEFDQFDGPFRDPFTGERLANAWGYNTVAFFAPESHYSYYGKVGEQVDEFKMLVRELHKHNIEVILDVVFNHTREGNHYGPTISFKGLDNNIYYMLDAEARVLQRLHGLRQHAELQPPGRPPVHPRLPALLGHRDARRRVPLRPGGGLRHRRRPAGEGEDADHPRDRDRPGPLADQADRRALEHPPVPARVVLRPPLGRVERQVPRHGAQVRQGGRRGRRRAGHARRRLVRPVRARRRTRSGRPSTASTS